MFLSFRVKAHPVALRALAHFDALFPIDGRPSGIAEVGPAEKAVDTTVFVHSMSNMLIRSSGSAIDLFCGCGGISEGLRMAGYRVIAGIDIERKYIATFKHNFPDANAMTESILAVAPETIARMVNVEPEELAILAGGPPCQGFSKNVPRRYRYLEDPKNQLVRAYLDYVEFLLPEIVLMENVAEMKNGFEGQYTDEVLERLSRVGYTITHAVLNAADYGVPQRRRRAFFMANRAGVEFTVPKPTHVSPGGSNLFSFSDAHVSVWDAISDLPSLEPGEKYCGGYSSRPLSPYQKIARGTVTKLSNHVARVLQPVQLARYAALLPGQGNKDLPEHLRSRGGYSGAYGRLTKDMIAPTITRWVFHPGSGRWGHPVDRRVLSIREVARIQGFPDSFEFVGSYLEQAGQLGNAVPPLLAATVAVDLQRQLRSHDFSSTAKRSSNESRSTVAGKSNETLSPAF